MFKHLLIIITHLVPTLLFAQGKNPFVMQGLVSPSPMYKAESNGVGVISFLVGNGGDEPIEVIKGKEIILEIQLLNGVPNKVQALDAITGSYAEHFRWMYDSKSRIFRGTQIQTFNGAMDNGVGDIIIAYKVSENSKGIGPQNGFNARLIVPDELSGINLIQDDEISAKTWTLLKPSPTPDFEMVKVNEILNSNVYMNDKVEKGTTYLNPVGNENNPSSCLPEINENGEFVFVCPKAGRYEFMITVCEPKPSLQCSKIPLTISVIH